MLTLTASSLRSEAVVSSEKRTKNSPFHELESASKTVQSKQFSLSTCYCRNTEYTSVITIILGLRRYREESNGTKQKVNFKLQ
jgi:hypothetical protein